LNPVIGDVHVAESHVPAVDQKAATLDWRRIRSRCTLDDSAFDREVLEGNVRIDRKDPVLAAGLDRHVWRLADDHQGLGRRRDDLLVV
jgi:hypothetical protein